MRNVIVVGATSGMAQEVARHYADKRDRLVLVARDAAKMQAVAQDLTARGATVEQVTADLADVGAMDALATKLVGMAPRVDVLFMAQGLLGSQEEAERSWAHADLVVRTNFTAVAALLTPLANHMEKQRGGTIAVISSVAGDRGRATNYVYGCAKAGLTAFLSGLRNRLFKAGVAVVTINPGFVATAMTAHLKKGPLVADVRDAGRAIHGAIEKRRDVVYVPWFWCWIMLIIRHLPEAVFKRMKL